LNLACAIEPTANFVVTGTHEVNHVLTFDASSSTDGDFPIDVYRWDFGDGSTVITDDETTNHVYRSASSGFGYRVSLIVGASGGGSEPQVSDPSEKRVVITDSAGSSGSGSSPAGDGGSFDAVIDAPGMEFSPLTVVVSSLVLFLLFFVYSTFDNANSNEK